MGWGFIPHGEGGILSLFGGGRRGEADLWNSSKIGRLTPDRYIGTGPLYIDGSLVYRLSSDRLIVEIGRGVGSEVKIG